MNKEKIGLVTEQEKEEILKLNERKSSLHEILLTLNSGLLGNEQKNELYEKVIVDLGKTNTTYQQWWNEMAKQYKWKFAENSSWIIDFDTNEIFLMTVD